MARNIVVFDTTLRDGEQAAGNQLNTAQKVGIAKQLERLGVDVIEAGFPVSSPGDLRSVQEISQVVTKPVIAALARAVPKDIDAAAEALKFAKKKRIHTFISSSDIHIEQQFRSTRQEVMQRAVDAIKHAKTYVDDVEFSAMDAGRTDNDFLAEFVEAAITAGATTVNIPDTTGYCLPDEFGAKIAYVKKHVKNIEQAVISVHCHNDLGMATANTIAGVQNGAGQIEVTINGVGERAGNTALEEAVMAIKTREKSIGAKTNIATPEIAAASRMVAEEMRSPVQANKAIVGRNAFAHASGIHQDGMMKHRDTYEIMRPEDVGIARSTLVLGARSGRKALFARLAELDYDEVAQPDAVYEQFLRMADDKTEVTDKDLRAMMEDVQYE